MKKILIIISLIIGISNAQQQVDIPWPTLADSPWPMIKHDPQFTGRSLYKGPQSASVAWTVDMPYGIFSGPVIGADKNLYFGSYYYLADFFYSFNQNGQVNWNYETGGNRAAESGILIDSSNTIYFGSRDGYLYAINQDGSLKWKYYTSAFVTENSIPNIDLMGNIYITTFIFTPGEPDRGELISIKPDGVLNWKVMYDNGFAFKSPVISPDGSTIYIPGVDSNLFALNLDGSIKWKFSSGEIMKAPMIDSNGNIYFIPREIPQYFYSLSPDGNIRWQYFIQELGPLDFYSIPTIDSEGNLYAIVLDTTCCEYNRMLLSLNYNGSFRWKYTLDDYESDDFWQPLICDSEGTVYFGSTFGTSYYAISSAGSLKWKLPLIEYNQQLDNTGAIASDGTLFLGVHCVSTRLENIKSLMAIRDTVTSVKNESKEVISYKLEQNYPNPFNSTTNIRYSIPQSGRVTITVYDLMGSEVAKLLDRHQEAGSYDVIFQPKDLASGIYFYTLTSENFTASKKLILLK